MTKQKRKTKQIYPFLPIRDIVIFPYMLVPLAVGRKRSVNAIKRIMDGNRRMVVAAQKDVYTEEPTEKDIYPYGVIVKASQILSLPDGSWRVLVEGERRVQIKGFNDNGECIEVEVEHPKRFYVDLSEPQTAAVTRNAVDLFEEYIELNPKIDIETYPLIEQMNEPDKISDIIASYLKLRKKQAQKLLEEIDPLKRMEKLNLILKKEIEILSIKKQISKNLAEQSYDSDDDYSLSDQVKRVKKGIKAANAQEDEIKEIKSKIENAQMSIEAKEQALKDLDRLNKMMPYSPEATVVRTYIDWLIKLPWNRKTRDNINLRKAQDILEADHYGLKEAKERILEYLAVSKLSKKLKTPILCFVGPPGTGKTSFGRSIARALGRKFIGVSLGGIRDEAEIRGHRRTYIGALPGRIIQSISKVGTKNPVFLLDEVDKMGKDFRGDPSSALLEALDPEQNNKFSDHYLEVPFDLSNVLFITTANTTQTIPPAMMDRMEILKFPGYTVDEKDKIAQKFLIPKQIEENGLKKGDISFTTGAVKTIINNFTREAGVRNLEREIAKVLRKIAGEVARKERNSARLTKKTINKYLGIPKYSNIKACQNDIGIAAGLSWTSNGGESLSIEVSLMKGEGKLKLTGKLGDIMKESAQTALSYVRANAQDLEIPVNFYKKNDIHIHVPAGAIPKEGPSAGITICTALVSILKNQPVKKDVVMTGEITLSGKILEIGGFKEKLLAAHRDRFKTVIFPSENKKNLVEVPSKIKNSLNLIPVENYKEVISNAF